MTKLRKFRTLEDKINLGLKIFCCLLILTIIVMGKSLAEYKQEAEVTFIRARVGKFKTNDIQLAMKLDGEEVETPPSKDNYTVDISCNNADGSWDSDRWGANIDNIRAGKVKCEVNFTTPAPTLSEVTATSEKTSISLTYTAGGIGTSTVCKWGTEEGEFSNTIEGATNTNCNINSLDMDTLYYYQVCAVNSGGESCKTGNIKTKPDTTIAEQVKVGDYISMTPTTTSYTLPNEFSGCTGVSSTCVQNTINPKELNLWRVINLNDDGTIDMVSHYTSSQKVYFFGSVGYKNLINGLNRIATLYTDGALVTRTRQIGYLNQTSSIKSEISTNPQPWKKSTDAGGFGVCDHSEYLCGDYESDGAGDVSFIKDLQLINSVYGNLLAGSKDEEGSVAYWLASRRYAVNGSFGSFHGRSISVEGEVIDMPLAYKTVGPVKAKGLAIRPIVTLWSGTEVSGGSGTSSKPYTLK